MNEKSRGTLYTRWVSHLCLQPVCIRFPWHFLFMSLRPQHQDGVHDSALLGNLKLPACLLAVLET